MDAPQTDLKQYADRLEFICRAQKAEIAKLRAEVERLQAVGGAHSVLKSIYLNGELPESLRAKAAIGCLQHEVPKLLPERQALELRAEPEPIPLLEIAEMRKAKAAQLEGQEIEVKPDGQVLVLKPGRGNGGNGDGSNND
jgi:hypothetical protein